MELDVISFVIRPNPASRPSEYHWEVVSGKSLPRIWALIASYSSIVSAVHKAPGRTKSVEGRSVTLFCDIL